MQYVNEKAKVICTGCPTPTSLNLKKARTTKINDKIIGVEADLEVSPFKPNCLVIPTAPKPCMPSLGEWTGKKSDVYAKGKKILNFPTSTTCAKGGLVTMVYAGQVTSREGATDGKLGDKSCKWKDCEKKHEYNITYPNNGVVKRKGLSNWSHPSALVEWNLHKPKFRKVLKKGVVPQYAFQRHHILPCAVFKKLPKVSHNLKLLGFNINHEGLNGISLPKMHGNIVWHDLQYHKGYHKDYNDKVHRDLKNLENSVVKTLCKTDDQVKLWEEIETKVEYYKNGILKWEIALYPDSHQKRARGFAKLGISVK